MALFCHIFPLAMEAVAEATNRKEVLMRIVKDYTKEYTCSLLFKASQKEKYFFSHYAFFFFFKKNALWGLQLIKISLFYFSLESP